MNGRKWRAFWAALACLLVLNIVSLAATAALPDRSPMIGVYYFPGWKDNILPARPHPWSLLANYPEKKPLLGYYREGDLRVMARQINWMKRYGIDFIVFDWYDRDGEVHSDHAIEAYRRIDQNDVKYAILWANAGKVLRDDAEWQTIVAYWLDRYVTDNNFLKIDGRPVIMIQAGSKFMRDARRSGTTGEAQLAWSQAEARRRGFPGVFFVAGLDVGADKPLVSRSGFERAGFAALTAYNYGHNPLTGQAPHGYGEIDQAYRTIWSRVIDNSSLPYIIPMSAGWDRRPWGGSADPAHDRSIATYEQFVTHLDAGRVTMMSQPIAGRPYGVICCWNEFGEGVYVEPTVGTRFELLRAIKTVFGGQG